MNRINKVVEYVYTNNLKKEKGITLVALVITIIILLILAGITISTLTQNGLFEKAKEAKVRSEEAQKLENETLEEYEKEITKATRESSNAEKYDISSLSTEYNPYGLPGYILYDKDSGILEVNLYEKYVSISNEAAILNVSFIPNLPTLNYTTNTSSLINTSTEFNVLSGTGLAIYGGWGNFLLKMRNNYDIEINNLNDKTITGIATYKRKY